MAGVLPATLRVASRSKIAPGDFVTRRVLRLALRVALRSKIAPGDFVNFRPLPPEYSATLVCNQEVTE